MRRSTLVVIIVLVILFIILLFSFVIKNDEKRCTSRGGIWAMAGRPNAFCNLPTLDANKTCNDSSQCEGACIANETLVGKCEGLKNTCYSINNKTLCLDKNATDIGKFCNEDSDCEVICSKRYEYSDVGQCSQWKLILGCVPIIREGRVGMICYD